MYLICGKRYDFIAFISVCFICSLYIAGLIAGISAKPFASATFGMPLKASAYQSAAPMRPVVVHSEKPKKNSGDNFKRWQQKMLFYLTTLHLASYLRVDAPVVDEDHPDTARRIAYDQWTQGDFLCRNYVFGGLVDELNNMYYKAKTVEEL
ncbi:hypothetical protein ACS0TY_014451 [Phlomoides rotata]